MVKWRKNSEVNAVCEFQNFNTTVLDWKLIIAAKKNETKLTNNRTKGGHSSFANLVKSLLTGSRIQDVI